MRIFLAAFGTAQHSCALGLIGIFFLTSETGIAASSEGYGIAARFADTAALKLSAALGRAETALCQRRRLLKPSGTAIFDARMKSTATSAVMSATV